MKICKMVCYPQVLSSSANERHQNSNVSCKEECIPRTMTTCISITFTAFIFDLACIQFPPGIPGTQNFLVLLEEHTLRTIYSI